MRIVLIAVLIFILTSCNADKSYITYCKAAGLILADTGYTASDFLSSREEDVFPIYYIGPRQDTICTGEPLWKTRRGRHKLDTTLCIYKYSPDKLSIVVDTLYPLTLPLDYFNDDGIVNADSTRYYHASAVILTNISDTALYMGITYSLFYMHREMRNSKGEWVKTEDKLSEGWFCATGRPDIILKPGEVMIAKVCRYGGEHPVACRFAFGRKTNIQVYSNVFTECIDDDMLGIIERNDSGKKN